MKLAFRIRLFGLLLPLTNMSGATPSAISYGKQIAPILFEHCTPCHRDGESGGFSLLTYADARRRARLIEQVTRSRFMPPWLPAAGHADFDGENRLTAAQIETIRQWVAAGAPEGSRADAPPTPVFTPGWQLGTPDVIVTAAKPFTVPADGPDIFWNFILSPKVPQARYVKSLEVRPGVARALHHAAVIVDRGRSGRHQEKSPGEGFPGMDLNIETPTFDPDSHFLFWKPGGRPWVEPSGMSWRLEPDNDLILNVHFHPTGKAEVVQPSVGLYFTDQPPTQFPMLLKVEHDSLLNIPAGARDFLVSDDFQLPVDVTAIAVYPHAHYLATLLEGYATLPDGSRQWLVQIPQWDVNWQSVYHYRNPLFLPKGTVISMRFHYDNSAGNPRNPSSPPVPVAGGNRAIDEMGHLWLQLLTPHGENDRATLQEAIMRHRLANDPSDASAHFNLGSLLLSRGDFAAAIARFQDALRFEPEAPMTLNDLGVALQSQGKPADAITHFEHALRIQPGYVSARFNLASALATEGKWNEAAINYRQVISAEPSDAAARDQLVALLIRTGNAAASEGRLSEAASCFRELIVERPTDAAIRNNFGIILARSGDLKAAADQFESALRIDPNHGVARRNLEVVRKKLAQP